MWKLSVLPVLERTGRILSNDFFASIVKKCQGKMRFCRETIACWDPHGTGTNHLSSKKSSPTFSWIGRLFFEGQTVANDSIHFRKFGFYEYNMSGKCDEFFHFFGFKQLKTNLFHNRLRKISNFNNFWWRHKPLLCLKFFARKFKLH